MEFLKLDPDIDSDPAIMSAGWWGARFFELLLRVSARKDLKGRITPEYQDLGWLARIWNLDDAADDYFSAKMERARDGAIGAGLIIVDGADWILKGWEKFYRPTKSNAQRQKEWRERNGSNDPPVTNNERNESNATPLHTTSRHSTSQHVERAAPEKSFVPSIPEKPAKPDELWDGMDFWAWAQAKRLEAGLQPERRPNERKVSAWWSQAQMQGVSLKTLRRAFVAFGCDPFWTRKDRAPPVPFGGFLSQWERFVTPEAGDAS